MSRRYTRRQFMRFAGSAAASLGACTMAGRQAGAASPASRRPNILFVFPDQHRYDWIALNPAIPVRTPNLVRLAQEGVRFETAFCPSPLCAPSRACLAVGKEYDATGVKDNSASLRDGTTMFYALLRDAGYRVGSVGKLDLRKPQHDWGPDGLHRVDGGVHFAEWGFTDGLDSEGKGDSFLGVKTGADGKPYGVGPYTRMLTDRKDGSIEAYVKWRDDRSRSRLANNNYSYTEPEPLADDAYNDNWVGQNGLNLIEGFPQDKPWFLQVNFPGPHGPMDITPSMADWYRGVGFPGPFANDQLPPETHNAIRRNYSAMVENIDRWLGRYLAAVEQRGELGRTIVVYSSDHGEMLGDHDRWAKGVPYQPSAVVPLIVSGPGVRRDHVHYGPAETLDLTATFLDYARIPVPSGMESRSMRSLLEGATDERRAYAISGLKEWRLVCDGRFKLIRGFDPATRRGDGSDEAGKPGIDANGAAGPVILFDLRNDPHEANNIAKDDPGAVQRLSQWLPKAA